jgi:hypothetical protein
MVTIERVFINFAITNDGSEILRRIEKKHGKVTKKDRGLIASAVKLLQRMEKEESDTIDGAKRFKDEYGAIVAQLKARM